MLIWLLLACVSEPAEREPYEPVSTELLVEAEVADVAVADLSRAARADLKLKRWRQLSLDLEGALELPEDEICREVGRFDCTTLHGTSMGGVSLDNNLFHPVDTIGATTDTAMERLVLAACNTRLEADREAPSPVVFGALSGAWKSEVLSRDARRELSVTLYRRLLGRDPLDGEVAALSSLHPAIVADGGDNAAWGLMSCFAVGTLTEALLY